MLFFVDPNCIRCFYYLLYVLPVSLFSSSDTVSTFTPIVGRVGRFKIFIQVWIVNWHDGTQVLYSWRGGSKKRGGSIFIQMYFFNYVADYLWTARPISINLCLFEKAYNQDKMNINKKKTRLTKCVKINNKWRRMNTRL